MKRILILAAIALGGCAAPVTKLHIAGLDRSDKVPVSDLRPKIESEGESFSGNIFSDAYALYRIADSAVFPPAVRLLSHRAFERFGGLADATELKVRHFVVYRNLQAELRRVAIGSGIGGVLGAVAVGPAVTASNGTSKIVNDLAAPLSVGMDEYKRALYTEAENPGKGSVYIVYIETELKSKRVFTRTVAPVKSKEGEMPLGMAVEAAIAFHLGQY